MKERGRECVRERGREEESAEEELGRGRIVSIEARGNGSLKGEHVCVYVCVSVRRKGLGSVEITQSKPRID